MTIEIDRLTARLTEVENETKTLRISVTTAIPLVKSYEARVKALEEERSKLRAALELWRSFGCPVCGGDCASANPPVLSCPMTEARAALAGGQEDKG
ncbi:MAG: hypothetical protein GEU78_08005 [Actinobacteria bacterium]|nr:hypothetical protein [Actinomycetota bacterium]